MVLSRLAAFFSFFLLSLVARGEPVPEALRIVEKTGALVHFDGVDLIDDRGGKVTFKSLLGEKPVIINLIYYRCPDICGLVLNSLLDNLREIDFVAGRDFRVISISIDPFEGSELARLKRESVLINLRLVKPEADWSFFTAEERHIRNVASQLGFTYRHDPRSGLYEHAPGIFVIDEGGKIIATFATVIYPKQSMEYALVSASRGRFGSVGQRLWFWLHRYDSAGEQLVFDKSKVVPILVFTLIVVLGSAFILIRRTARGN